MLASVGLQDASNEAVWEEEASQPEARRMAILCPLPHEAHSLAQVSHPRGQGLQRGERDFLPVLGHTIVQQVGVHRIKHG